MSREIRFRAWHNRKMLYHNPMMSTHDFIITPDGKVFYTDEPGYVNGKNHDSVIMQYTGLKDKNGKEIYEGDIFRIEEEEDNGDKIFYVVIVWVKEWAMFCSLLMEQEYKEYLRVGIKALDEPMFWTYTLEDTNSRKHFLCGNIYSNPELLKDETKS